MTDRASQLAAFCYRLYWSSNFPFERLGPEIQEKHVAMAEELLKFLESQGWLKS